MVKPRIFGDTGDLMVCNGSGFEFRASSLEFRVSGFGFRVSGLGSRVSGLGFQPDKVGDAHPTFVPHETKCPMRQNVTWDTIS
ncbi:MAG: hypothetical protein HW390_2440 [Candidatus Brocadiaceae bacterium]|nr:hypothetical protein [Candidatus Brocadiaceae bacterium]